ncbi:heptaprenyl diphosphate synthase component 1 [Ferviditalea candida]|uniref:Heptaprenyl diphosphate synthase component 1 n=1 Tax=Ferviditalea candida TaxID=3108399 RepID=A0ABU5ZMU4_9BACL|nr:heptaprenyl diphosphate synthase component 1 [Paenibacillaceae bacterium T2]
MEYRIREMVLKYTDYDMIQSHTVLPEYPDLRTRLLYLFLDKETESKEHNELAALVTSLVQMGLDTHELVQNAAGDGSEPEAVRSKQLKVLAGDYFSGRFYQLLSQAGRIDMIFHLSQAICEVNRLKMNFYLLVKQLQMTAEEYIQHMVKINMELYLSMVRFVDDSRSTVWPEVLDDLTRCEVLAQEMKRARKLDSFAGSWGYWHIIQRAPEEEKRRLMDGPSDDSSFSELVSKYEILPQLSLKLEQQLNSLFDKIERFDSERIIRELRELGMSFMRHLTKPAVLP